MKSVISVNRIHDHEKGDLALQAMAEQHLQDVRRLAFEYSQQRVELHGSEWDDWLRAEREIAWRPHAEMLEDSSAVVLRIGVPGLDKESVQVTATPYSMVVQAMKVNQHKGIRARLHFSEFGKRLFRRFDLPSRIEPSKVSATLDKGILEIVATLAELPSKDQGSQSTARSKPAETPCAFELL